MIKQNKRIEIRIPTLLLKRLDRIVVLSSFSRSDVIRIAIDEFIKNKEKKDNNHV